MKIATLAIAALFLVCLQGAAQTGAALPTNTGTALSVTINYPSPSVVTSMFGKLPNDVALIEVTACNDTPQTLVLSNGRVVQAMRHSGIQVLSRDAAIATLSTSESHTWQSILMSNSTHAMNIVNFLVISKAVALGPALSKTLPAVQALMEAIIPEFSRNVPNTQYLNFDHDALPASIQLTPLDCAEGMMFTGKLASPAPSQLVLVVPSVAAAPAH
ncbi:MAG: hypothetical protein ABSB15_25175 [Bryobacteraceae bacterium]|jgi:hypothetical protein